jgi:hypothetical protein
MQEPYIRVKSAGGKIPSGELHVFKAHPEKNMCFETQKARNTASSIKSHGFSRGYPTLSEVLHMMSFLYSV